ncbi:hypothetical protein BS47DRAFT_1364811 [Hydnum rufescens UP504]|uniref:Uncharacterized protein n=1 Tax=Hydnum rufescens UP504 TaxID=1448309 RepID=A0A9P6ARH7_9AGAM|nr:hypothetical protein BS47DRAFT_1364811 [Hydnum rufescens UP504]
MTPGNMTYGNAPNEDAPHRNTTYGNTQNKGATMPKEGPRNHTPTTADCGHNENPRNEQGPEQQHANGDVMNGNAPKQEPNMPMSGPIYRAPGAPGLLDLPP